MALPFRRRPQRRGRGRWFIYVKNGTRPPQLTGSWCIARRAAEVPFDLPAWLKYRTGAKEGFPGLRWMGPVQRLRRAELRQPSQNGSSSRNTPCFSATTRQLPPSSSIPWPRSVSNQLAAAGMKVKKIQYNALPQAVRHKVADPHDGTPPSGQQAPEIGVVSPVEKSEPQTTSLLRNAGSSHSG